MGGATAACWRRMPLCMVVLSLLLTGRLHAQEAWPPVFDRLVDSQRRLLEAEAERAALHSLTRALQSSLEREPAPAAVPAADGFHLVGVRATVARTFESAGALHKANADRRAIFDTSIAQLCKEKDRAHPSYRAALQAAFQEQAERARIEWELQQSLDEPDGWQRFFPPLTARALLLALGAGCLGVLVLRFEERLAVRRFRRRLSALGSALVVVGMAMGISAVLALALMLAWLAFAPAPEFVIHSPDNALQQRIERANQTIQANQQRQQQVDQQIISARRDFDALLERGAQGWNTLFPADKDNPLAEVQKIERETAAQVRTLFQLAHAADRLAQEAHKVNEQTSQDHQRLEEFAGTSADRGSAQAYLRVGGVGAPLVLFALAIAGSRWRRWRAWRRQSRECPRCLQTKLHEAPRAEIPMPAVGILDLQCAAERCGYVFPALVNRLPRLYLATCGQAGSGKTTWLALVHDQLNTGDTSLQARVKSIRTAISISYDEIARQILSDKKPPAATPTAALPEPLLFHVVDGDALAPSQLLLNVFDFPGAMSQGGRALVMHGFIFFLDPTAPIEPQWHALLALGQNLRELYGLDVDARLNVPIAVCITKLDRAGETALNRMALPWLAELRKTQRQPITLALLQARSEMVRQVASDLFQGFNLVDELRKQCGTGCLFFPQANFGLEEEELGLPLEERGALTSFGTREPLIWLLYMNGLQVL